MTWVISVCSSSVALRLCLRRLRICLVLNQSAENKTEILSSLEWGFLHNGIFCILNASLDLHHSLQSPTYSS
ncbi:hypothetical protein T05_6952 [Trichinella murrelli]|uniref:Uncharacterized protein n=1 Tax=Trichinella murrelli TaxID=144512 RepID=A0A0V0U467_9BILA|nr:hypothetical protein T05_6952 [Trichinella murrelli]